MKNNAVKKSTGFTYEIIDTISSDTTLRIKLDQNEFYLHSVIDPKVQGQQFAKVNYSNEKDLFLYGLGLGYHVVALRELLSNNQKLYILECNEEIASYAMQLEAVRNLLEDDCVNFVLTSKEAEVTSFINGIPPNVKKIYYYPSVKTIPAHLGFLRDYLMDLRIESNVSPDQLMMHKNHQVNSRIYRNFLSNYHGAFDQMPCVVSVSGPSLREHESLLETYKNHALFISAGRNSAYFNDIGFEPDIYMEVDEGSIPVNRFDGFDSNVLLLGVSTVKPELLKNYKGPKAQIIMGQSNEAYYMTGGGSTVASTAIELAITLGCNPIILIGQDLCYIDGNSHFNQREASRASAPVVLCNDGENRKTNEAFLKHKRSIEKLIAIKGSDVQIYTISKKGVQLRGVEYIEDGKMLKALEKKNVSKRAVKAYIDFFN